MNIGNTVMGVFKAFGAEKNPNVRVTKIGCAEGCPPKIPIGTEVVGTLTHGVEVGASFNIVNATIIKGGNLSPKNLAGVKYGRWSTSIIQKVLNDNTFETKNSIYKWEAIKA